LNLALLLEKVGLPNNLALQKDVTDMKSGKTTQIITVCLFFFLSGLCAGAQQMDWDKSMAAARAARQGGECAN
jgi:hypothetical protein